MARATWKGAEIAQSDETRVVEGNHYFPPDAVDHRYLRESDHTSVCPWKGTARYWDVVVDGDVNENAAWTYPQTKEKARPIEGYVAFWHGVEVEE
jgi:uncharacterized protein (DUF427 family)